MLNFDLKWLKKNDWKEMIDTKFNGFEILGAENDESAKLWLKSTKNLHLAVFESQKVACSE